MTDVLTFALSLMPPPLHACFDNAARNGRIDTPRYTLFKQSADAELAKNIPNELGTPYKARFKGDVIVSYIIKRPDKRTRDLDNLLKALCDLLKRNHILGDDSQIVDLRIRWATPQDALTRAVAIMVERQVAA